MRVIEVAQVAALRSLPEFLRALLEVRLVQLVAPMLQCLAHHRTNGRVVELGARARDLRDQVVPPAASQPRAPLPAPHLPRVVLRVPALEEAAEGNLYLAHMR